MTATAPLAGYVVGITAARRADELGTLFVRQGATVRYGPALRIVPLADDTELHAATAAVLAEPPEFVVATTGIGFRGWIEAAESWGLGAELLTALRGATVLTRGPKATGAVRTAGLSEAYSPASESTTELLAHLLRAGIAGRRIAVQLHGEPLPYLVAGLREAGADVVKVPVYRWVGPGDPGPLDRLIDAVLDGCVDAMPFTSAPAVASTLARARRTGRHTAFVNALRTRVVAGCVGPVTAAPLAAVGVPTVRPGRARLGALAHTLAAELTARSPRLGVAGRTVEIRGQSVFVDGEARTVAPAPMAVLRALAERPGRVVSRAELTAVLPDGGEEHAVEVAVGRLRRALGDSGLVRTVVKRGYRLAVAPGSDAGEVAS